MRTRLIAEPVERETIWTERPRWHRRAACNGLGADLFHPEGQQGGSTFHAGPWSVCEQCPVSAECLATVLEIEQGAARIYRQGLYAFSTPTERERIDQGAAPYDGRHCGSVRGWQKHKLWGQVPCDECQRRWEEFKAKHPEQMVRLERPPLRAVNSARRQAPTQAPPPRPQRVALRRATDLERWRHGAPPGAMVLAFPSRAASQ